MKLKKLKVIGFKSFADPIKLEFHAGITAIVGPNGCGKSNIADAFRWVLGEQSAKSLRGGKMQDVIFAGTSQRKPLNYAEVTLTMSHVEGHLPLGYEEVEVTRRLHRSGESDYCINNQGVRLKDIQDLFLDSGMGKNAFAIFEQGKIEQIIQSSPLERRYVFEEAAGILRFLQRKREALRRLEQTDINTSRLKDIHLEVERQIVILEEQSEKARFYKRNRSQLEALELAVMVAKWDLAQKRRSDISQKEAEQLEKIEEEHRRQAELNSQIVGLREHLAKGEHALRVKSEEVYKTRSDKAVKAKEKQSHQERLKESAEKEKRWQHELEAMLEKRKIRQVESGSIRQQQIDGDTHFKQLDCLVKEQRKKVSSVDQELSKTRDQQQASQQKLMGLLQKESRLESDLKQNTVRLENDQERKLRLLQRKEILSKQLYELTQQIKERQSQSINASKAIDEQKTQLAVLERQYAELTSALQEEQTSLGAVQQEIQEAKARQKSLERMRQDMEGFTVGSKRLLQESQTIKSPLFGKIRGLHEYFVIEKGSESFLAAALKPYAQTLVVDDEIALEEVLAYTAKHKLKDFSILCLSHIPAVYADAKIEVQAWMSLATRVDANKVSRHFLQHVHISETKEIAHSSIKGQGGQAVTADGFYIDSRHVLFQPIQSESNVFVREAELKNIGEQLRACEAVRDQCELALEGLQKKRLAIQQTQLEQDKCMRKAEMSLLEINFAVQRLQGDEGKASQEIQGIEKESQDLSKNIEALQALVKELLQKHSEARIEAAEFQKQSGTLQEDLQALSMHAKQELQSLKERELAAQKVSEESRKLAHALHVNEVKDLESIDQEKRLKEEISLSQQLQKELFGKGDEVDKGLLEVEVLLEKFTLASAEMEKEVGSFRQAIKRLENDLAACQLAVKLKEQEWNQTRIGAAQLEASLLSLEAEQQDRYQKSMEEARAEAIPLEKSLDHTEKQIKSLRQELEEAGDVNLAAIDECDKNKARYATLNDQLDDLGFSRQEMIQIITALDGESRKIFKDTFQKIRANFQKNFQILFSGGEADLQFTETEDVLEAGIEIIARPPGKQMRSIQLLSGGEKCLTAMALLFAIFEVKPAPFCILDEIDAPLDDANVERFVQMVKHYVDRCQFIIITHNKRTMAIADVILGVSMEERGVSKLLSLAFSNETATVNA